MGILRRAGIDEAGRSFAVDFLQFVGGVIPGMNTTHEQPMAVGTLEHYESDGIILLPKPLRYFELAVEGFGFSPLRRLARGFAGAGVKAARRLERNRLLRRGGEMIAIAAEKVL